MDPSSSVFTYQEGVLVPLTITNSSAAPAAASTDWLVLFRAADGSLIGAPLTAAIRKRVLSVLSTLASEPSHGAIAWIPGVEGIKAGGVVVVSVGDPTQTAAWRAASGILARAIAKQQRVAIALPTVRGIKPDALAQAVGEGVLLGGYRYDEYRSVAKPSNCKVSLLGGTASGLRRAKSIAEGVCFARDLMNAPALDMPPAVMAQQSQRFLRARGVKVDVMTLAAIRAAGLGGVIGVGQGSEREARFLKMEYVPSGRPTRTIALVGKGVTFDTGGISIKPADGMETMKTDMGGAAAVIGALGVCAALGVKARVLGFTPLVENMPSGSAIRPGDVLRMRNGTTVEVINTDAEGRLILADALCLASEAKPDAIVDLATLTGACVVALGEKYAGIMTNDEQWGKTVRAAADRAGEPMWPLPLPGEYRKQLESEIADMKNIGTRWGGTLTAGLFLKEFVKDGIPWAHLDIAGPSRAGADDGEYARGGTGFGVRTLLELLES